MGTAASCWVQGEGAGVGRWRYCILAVWRLSPGSHAGQGQAPSPRVSVSLCVSPGLDSCCLPCLPQTQRVDLDVLRSETKIGFARKNVGKLSVLTLLCHPGGISAV